MMDGRIISAMLCLDTNNVCNQLKGIIMKQNNLDAFINDIESSRALIVDDYVCGTFSLTPIEELHNKETDIVLSCYIYGERGMMREYDIDINMIKKSKKTNNKWRLTYYDSKPLSIELLSVQHA
jgi:hypothetical protein